MAVGCYFDANILGLWVHNNPQDPICDKSRTGFLVTFSICTLFCVSKIKTKNLFIPYILSMCHCHIMLETDLP